jgi:hypothetical protein
MMRKFRLRSSNSRLSGSLEFEWDPETGKLGGRDAEEVRIAAEEAKRAGYALGHPHPTSYRITDPLRRMGDMAVILGSLWRLSPELAAAYPKKRLRKTRPGEIN